MLSLLMAVCAPFTAQELNGDLEAAFARRMDEWKTYVSAYRPDYSDSSKYLLPPEDNRLAEPFAVVKDGKPAAVIALDGTSKEDTVLRTAAEELQRHLKLITGVELPIRYDAHRDATAPVNRICLGKRTLPGKRTTWFVDGVWRERLAATDGNCGKDGFAIRLDEENPHHLHVFGTTSKGTMNGVMALIENNTDLIWARPNEEIGTVFTPRPGNLSFTWGRDYVSAPATRARGWNDGRKAAVVWSSHNRCNLFNGGGGGDISYRNETKGIYGVYRQRHVYGHTFHFFMHGCDDPEIFARDANGKRLPEPPGWGNNPCFTSEKALAVFSSNLVACARMAPTGTDRIYAGIEDSWDLCCCEKCLAPITLPDGTVITKDADNFRSTQFWRFYNRAAENLAKEVPGIALVNLAYFFTAAPPACGMRPDVIPEFAPYVRPNDKTPIFSPENAFWMKRLVGWSKICREIETYDYYGLGLGFPRPLAEVRAFDFTVTDPFIAGWTSENNTMEDAKDSEKGVWDVSAMEQWVLTRLNWDPTQDVEQLRKYFIRRTYREAAPAVEKVYGLIREEWFRSTRGSTLGDDPIDLTKLLIVEKGHVTAISNLLETAVATAAHPQSKVLAARLRDRMLHFINAAASLKNPKVQLPLIRVQNEPDFDDPVWKSAAELEGLLKCFKSDRKTAAKNATEVRLFHDSDNIRMRIRCTEPKIAEIRKPAVPLGEKELIVMGEHLEIYLSDPLKEGGYFLFSVSPDDIVADWSLGPGGAWNGEWSHRARRTATGWEAVLKFPLKTINADNAKGNDLKMLILREAEPIAESSSWGGGGWHQFATFGDVKLLR